ncbi:hypothetical protein KR059_006967, partial [Drosophila kikkawai]
ANAMGDSARESNILSLNSFCLYNIFRRIKINCENAHNAKDTVGQYLDLMNFAISCETLTKVFREWDPELYEELRLTLDFSNRGPLINVNLSSLYKFMQKQSPREQKLFWSAYLNAIRENDELKSVKVTYKPSQYYPQHLDRFEALLDALKEKKTLRKLDITMRGYSFEYVEIKGLKTLHLDARMDVNDLIQLCQGSPNLRRLKLTSAEISGRLSDIVPYCNHLEYLTISMKEDLDAAEYAPLAQLPKLKDLTLLGEPIEGSLLKLFRGLKEISIQQISIPNVYITMEEQYALSEILSLTSLKCCPKDTYILQGLFYEPKNLKKTYLSFPLNRTTQMDLETVVYRMRAVVRSRKIDSPETAREIARLSPGNDELDWGILAHALQYYVEAWITMDEIGLLAENYSKSALMEVSKLELSKDMPITQKVIDTLGAFPSITYIRCYLHQLEQIIAVKLQHLNSREWVFRRMDRIRTEHCEVRVLNLEVPEIWTVVLDFFEKDVSIDGSIFTPLVNLRNLTSLIIGNSSGNGSLKALFKSFASMETHILEYLRVPFLGPEEVAEVAKIRSLKELECGFFCSRFIDHLATMNQLQLLNINVHPMGRLRDLFKALASKQNQTLTYLIVERTVLTFEEVIEVARIESLWGLQLGLPDRQNWQHSPSHRAGNQYVRYCQKCQLPPRGSDIFQHRIYTKALPFIPQEVGLDTQVRFLTELYETSTPLNLNLLTKLPRLRWLDIHLLYSIPAVENLCRTLALEAPQRTRKITFPSQDFKLMSQFEELQYLDCFVYHMQDIESVGLLRNLKELILHNIHGIEMWEILRELRELPYLECLVVNGKDLDNYEIAAVVNIKTLTRLTVGLASNEWFKYLILAKNLEILEVTSTHFANENEVDYINLICMKCIKLKTFSLFRYYGYITKIKVRELVNTLRSVRDATKYPYLLLRGIWVDFERL